MKKSTLHPETELVTTGLASPDFGGVVNVPVCRASTIVFRNFDDFEAAERGEYRGTTYGRYGNPTRETLEASLAKLDGADHAITFQAGLAAVTCSILAFVDSGDHMLMVDTVYGPARRFCDQVLKRMGVEVTYYDPCIGKDIAKLIKPNTKVVYLESPGSLTFEVQDIDAIVGEAKKHGCIVVADNTWATPMYFKPFEHGIDVSMHSVTKYINGHADVMMGVLTYKSEHHRKLLYTSRNLGACPSADDCYLVLRGMRTLAIRLARHADSAMKVAKWLKSRPEVTEVFYPALPGAPGHDLWKKYYSGATALFSVEIKPASHQQLAAMIDGLELFHMGYSWGGFESLITLCHLEKTRTAVPSKHKGPLLRIHIGLENPDDIIADLEAGFARLKKAG